MFGGRLNPDSSITFRDGFDAAHYLAQQGMPRDQLFAYLRGYLMICKGGDLSDWPDEKIAMMIEDYQV